MHRRLVVLLAIAIGMIVTVAATTTTAVSAAGYAYDAPALARVDGCTSALSESGSSSLGDVREWSVSRSVEARGMSTTSHARTVATNTVGLADDAVTTVGAKISGQMGSRGWTQNLIDDTLAGPSRTVITRDTRWTSAGTRLNDPATAFIRADGSYVVRNDVTGDIVQISNRNEPNWIAPWD